MRTWAAKYMLTFMAHKCRRHVDQPYLLVD